MGFHFSEKATLRGALKKLMRDTLRGACVNNVGFKVCVHCGVNCVFTLWGDVQNIVGLILCIHYGVMCKTLWD